MRTVSAALAAAQKQHIGEPVAQVVIDDRHVGVFRPRWEPLVSDSVPDGPTAVGLAYDGAILRARCDPTTQKLYIQRITDPASTSQWTAWTLLESGVSATSQIALAWDGNTIQALFFVASDERTIKVRQSADNGQTWSAAATVTTVAAGHRVLSLAASLNAGMGTLYCFYGDEAGPVQVYVTWRDEADGAWSTPQSWGRGAVASMAGLVVDGTGSQFNIAACINRSLRTFVVPVESLGAWPAATEVIRSDSADVSYGWPTIGVSFGQHYDIFFVEQNGRMGSTRLNHVITPDWDNVSMFPRPYGIQAAYSACSVADATDHYLCTGRYVYRARRWSGDSSQRVTVSADVVALRLREHLEQAGDLQVTLRNDDGRYAAVGSAGQYEAVKQGSQVSVRLGYRTAAGDEVSYYRPYWITGLLHQRHRGRSVLLVTATDGWGLLDRLRARQGYSWTNTSVLAILTAILVGLGFYVTNDGSDIWMRTVALFVINPGMSLGEAVRRLLRLAGGHLIFRSDAAWEATWPSAMAHLATVGSAGTYAYGGDHPIIEGDYRQMEQAVTHVVALGEAQAMGEALDWQAIALGNEDRVSLVVDRRLATAAEAQERAGDELAAWQRAATGGTITVPPNVGQEILDVISLTDASAGLSAATRLVVSNEITLDRERGVFEQRMAAVGNR